MLDRHVLFLWPEMLEYVQEAVWDEKNTGSNHEDLVLMSVGSVIP
jgi:hypothetical protein